MSTSDISVLRKLNLRIYATILCDLYSSISFHRREFLLERTSGSYGKNSYPFLQIHKQTEQELGSLSARRTLS